MATSDNLDLAAQCLENERQRHPELGKQHKRDGTSRRRLAKPWNREDDRLTLHVCDSVKQFLYGVPEPKGLR